MTTTPATPTTQPTTTLREEAEAHLRALVGRGDVSLREDQWTAIEALVAQRRRALVVQRTGWGKSAVYFVATALLRARGAGPTVIVSPLLALMRNQIAAAERAGIRAATVNSGNLADWEEIYARVGAGQVDVLLVSPERLNNPDFRDRVLPRLTAATGLVVVDEAHCVSDWGHDFRPDYRRIRTLLAELPSGIPVLATTATANERVTRDVAEQLSSSGDGRLGEVLVLRGSLDRSSLHLGVVELPTAAARLAWLAEHLGELPGSGIVYCLTVAATTQVAEHLSAAGHAVTAYSGQSAEADRLAAEADLLANRVKAVVSTSALGMGFDKPDLGFVVHLGAPPSPIAYYQQVGRAGRAVETATVVLLPGREDREVWDYFASLAFPAEHLVRQTLAVLAAAEGPTSTPMLEPRVDLSRARLEMMLKVLDVDGAVRRVRGGWVATGQPWQYDEERYQRVTATRKAEQRSMLDYVATAGCRMEHLRRALDDPQAGRCGRCDRCGGLRLAVHVGADSAGRADDRLHRPGVVLEPRRQWPSGMAALGVELSGRIPAGEQAEAGRAVGRVTDLGWGPQVRRLFAPGVPDEELPNPIRHAIVAVLREWDPQPRPGVVVALESRRRPLLVGHLATGLSHFLGLPLATRFGLADALADAEIDSEVDPDVDTGDVAIGANARPDDGVESNSAQRLAAVSRRFRLEDPAAVAGQSVLLIDDRALTGWTLAVAARELRLAGATAVHPLVIAAT